MKIIKIGSVTWYLFSNSHKIGLAASIGKHFFVLDVKPFFERVRKIRLALLPSFWLIGLHDCDSGGRMTCAFRSMAWSGHHLKRLEREWHAASDGPATVRQVSLMKYLKFKNRREF